MNLNFVPTYNFVVVEEIKNDTIKSAAGIIMSRPPEKVARGIVHAVGPGFRMQNGEYAPSPIKVGDKVVYGSLNPNFATSFYQGGKQLLVIRDSDIFGIDTTAEDISIN